MELSGVDVIMVRIKELILDKLFLLFYLWSLLVVKRMELIVLFFFLCFSNFPNDKREQASALGLIPQSLQPLHCTCHCT